MLTDPICFGLAFSGLAAAEAPDPLPSWNDGASKQAITRFVAAVTTSDGPRLVPPVEGDWTIIYPFEKD